MSRQVDYTKPLPDCDGPKLSPFKKSKAKIKFRRLISDSSADTSGGHSHVFDVTINSIPYALKIFKFYDDDEDEEALSIVEREKYTADDVRAHDDPFYRECRAYGKLIEADLNGKIAVRCHGFLTISAIVEDELREKFKVGLWDRPDEEYDEPVSKRQPLRAIVKDLILSDVEFSKKDVYRMLHNLKRLRKLAVYPMDIASRNYREGLLVDFSAAITEPYYLFKLRPKSVHKHKQEDLLQFDRMIKMAGIEITQFRALADKQYMEKLRHRGNRGTLRS